MKYLFLLFMLFSNLSFAQNTNNSIIVDSLPSITIENPLMYQHYKCGEWVPSYIKFYTDWEDVKIYPQKEKSKKRNWVYSDTLLYPNDAEFSVYCPCGCEKKDTWIQYRVCRITGIIQKRNIYRTYEYVPAKKDEYQKTIDSLYNNKNNNLKN